MYNTKVVEERISKHIPEIEVGMLWYDCLLLIANKLDEYKKQLEEKQKIIDRLVRPEEG